MKQEFVTLPREVVERAIEALRGSETPTYRAQYDIEIDALVDLRSALEQPDAETPATAPEGWKLVPVVPTPKMVSEGSCAVTLPGPRYIDESAAKKCWAHMLAAAPQPPTTKDSSVVQPQANQPAMTPIAQRKLDSLLTEGYTISGYSVYHELKHQHGFVTGAGLVGWWKPDGVEYPQPRGEQEPAAEHELKDVRCECCGYMTHHREHMGCIRAAHTKREPLSDDDLCKVFPAIATYTESNKTLYRSIARAIESAYNIK